MKNRFNKKAVRNVIYTVLCLVFLVGCSEPVEIEQDISILSKPNKYFISTYVWYRPEGKIFYYDEIIYSNYTSSNIDSLLVFKEREYKKAVKYKIKFEQALKH